MDDEIRQIWFNLKWIQQKLCVFKKSLFHQTLNILLHQFSLPLMSHIDKGIFYFDPESCLIMNMHVLFSWFLYSEKSCFLSSFPVSYDSDEFPQLEIINPCFFSEFSFCCFFECFSDFTTTFWQHECTFFMTDTKYFGVTSSFSRTDTTSTWLEPKEGRNIYFYAFYDPSKTLFFLLHTGIVDIFSKNLRKKFA